MLKQRSSQLLLAWAPGLSSICMYIECVYVFVLFLVLLSVHLLFESEEHLHGWLLGWLRWCVVALHEVWWLHSCPKGSMMLYAQELGNQTKKCAHGCVVRPQNCIHTDKFLTPPSVWTKHFYFAVLKAIAEFAKSITHKTCFSIYSILQFTLTICVKASYTSERTPRAIHKGIIGASVSEPPSSDANRTFFYIFMYIYMCRTSCRIS